MKILIIWNIEFKDREVEKIQDNKLDFNTTIIGRFRDGKLNISAKKNSS